MFKKILLAVMVVVMMQGCASKTMRLEPSAGEGQEVRYISGLASVVSGKKNIVGIQPAYTSFESTLRPEIIILVLSNETESFDFSTENIEVTCDGNPLKVFTYDEVVQEIRDEMKANRITLALLGAMSAMSAYNAGNEYSYGNIHSSFDSNGQHYEGNSYYSEYSYRPGASQQAYAAASSRLRDDATRIDRSESESMASAQRLLRRTTIMPHSKYYGHVLFEQPPSSSEEHLLVVKITTKNETHSFNVKLEPLE